MSRTLGLGLGLLLVATGLAAAQDDQPVSGITGRPSEGDSRLEIGLAFAQAVSSPTFNSSLTTRDYAEDGTFNGAYKVAGSPGGALDLQYNLSPRFGLRVGGQTFSRSSDGTFDAQIPHPFFFSQPRSVSGTASDLTFSERAYSLTGVLRGGSGNWTFSLDGGPAYFTVEALVAEKVTFSDAYPFDTATFTGVTSSKHKLSKVGFSVGLEIGREFNPSVAAVIQGRFAQASGKIDLSGQKVGIKAGGGQVRVGLRFFLARKRGS